MAAKEQLAVLEQGVCIVSTSKRFIFILPTSSDVEVGEIKKKKKSILLIDLLLFLSGVLSNQVDIVVGTPGRLDDLISTGKLSMSQIRFLVLDECVRTTRLGSDH